MSKESLNGYEFIATYRPEAEEGILPGRIILGRLPTAAGYSVTKTWQQPDTYVTAYLPDGDTAWQFGHYFNNQLEATVDYRERTARGM